MRKYTTDEQLEIWWCVDVLAGSTQKTVCHYFTQKYCISNGIVSFDEGHHGMRQHFREQDVLAIYPYVEGTRNRKIFSKELLLNI